MRRTVVQKTIWVRRTLAAAAVGALLPATRIKVRASFATRSDERTGPGESVRVDCAGEMRKTKCYSLVLFVLLLTIGVGAAGIGVLSAREAEAQEATYCDDLADLVTGASNTDLTCQGLRLQSQRDDYWKDLVIGANKDAGNRKATMEKCGSYLAALSTVMEFVVRGHPYRHVDTNGWNAYGW